MAQPNRLREFRAEEIVKIFLLKSNFKLNIEKFPTPMFDFFIRHKDNPDVKFAIEVKSKRHFQDRVNRQIEKLKTYRDAGLITLPVLLIKVDEDSEIGEFDFLIFPSFKEDKLLIRYTYKFQELNNENFTEKLNTIQKWYLKS